MQFNMGLSKSASALFKRAIIVAVISLQKKKKLQMHSCLANGAVLHDSNLRIRTLSRARGSLVMLSLCTPTLFVVMTPSNSSLERCSLLLARPRPAFSKNLL
jgi:hypothetical protein